MRGILRFAAAVLALAFGGPACAADFPAIMAEKPPRLLSEYGFFPGPGLTGPAGGLVAYDLATPLFSDRALKFRHVHVPEGKTAAYAPSEAFDFPVGSALIKTFAYPADFREPQADIRLIETRLLLRRADGWLALAYVWNEEQTDAELKIAGKRLPVSFLDEQGSEVSFSYAVPNRNQCKGCHSIDGEIAPIGPKARNLNRPHGPEGGNQLEAWAAQGLLSGLPELRHAERAADFRDEAEPLELRARSWLDINCAHCHRPEGPASNSGLYLTFGNDDPVSLGIGKRPVAAGRAAAAGAFDIVPGDPDRSILYTRVVSAEPGVMMPELGRSLPDPDAAALLRAWIKALD